MPREGCRVNSIFARAVNVNLSERAAVDGLRIVLRGVPGGHDIAMRATLRKVESAGNDQHSNPKVLSSVL
jgi:hypothetical protein